MENQPTNPLRLRISSYESQIPEFQIPLTSSYSHRIARSQSLFIPFNPYSWKIVENGLKSENFENFQLKKTLHNQIPTCISESWIAISNLKLLKKSKNFCDCVDAMKKEFNICGWKRTRNDGNSWYRAVMAKYLEMACKVYAPLGEIEEIQKVLSKWTMEIKGQEELSQAKNELLKEMSRENQEINRFFLLLENFQKPEFDKILVMTGRLLSANVLASQPEIFQIIPMGLECSQSHRSLIATALNIKITVIDITEDQFHKETYGENSKFSIVLLQYKNEYFLTYSTQEMELENYDFSTSSYNFPKFPEFFYGKIRSYNLIT